MLEDVDIARNWWRWHAVVADSGGQVAQEVYELQACAEKPSEFVIQGQLSTPALR